ncbi:MAG: uroporphyrinogen-III C-methyltransferase [Oscillospiraceae bacterium]|nr:uroporphyrinogen-III C-methyltransferase [Oscillospiraceae bacterium]
MSRIGKVFLVGAGPGSGGLLTLRGKQVIEQADLVLYDRLVGREVLEMIPDSAEKMHVGKSCGRHRVSQDEINEMLVRCAGEGKQVVRLKGGDPYLFGRGAEELDAVLAAGIPFEVVPGVSSAIAVPAFAGIPVSHREFSSSVHIITAHRKKGAPPEIDYQSLVKCGGTLVFLMGIRTMSAVTEGLLSGGMDGKTPAALIENGTRPNQRSAVSTLAEISTVSRERGFSPPSILAVGEVCGLAGRMNWFERLPLCGVGVIVTRPRGRDDLSRQLRELGADVIGFPCAQTAPLPVPGEVAGRFAGQDWIVFTSTAGVGRFFETLREQAIDLRSLAQVKFAAIGSKTAGALAGFGIIADYTPETYSGEALAEGLPLAAGRTRVMLFRAREGAPSIVSTLRERGFEVEDIPAYRTASGTQTACEIRGLVSGGNIRFVTFTSPSTVQGFVGALDGVVLDRAGLTAVCIGEETAAAARRHGLKIEVSKAATSEDMVKRILQSVSDAGTEIFGYENQSGVV